MKTLLPTALVGSYSQPEWLIDRKKLAGRFPPRVRAKELWRVAPEFLEQAQDDATILAIRDQERAESTLSPTARCGVRATPTASQRRWTASTSIALARRSIVAAIPIPCRALSVRSAVGIPLRCVTYSFCVPTLTV